MKVERKENSKIVYYIDEEKRTIVCKMENCRYDVIDALSKDGLDYVPDGFSSFPFYLNNTYSGKAVCLAEDNWDIEKGKRLALSKMLNHYYTDKEKAYNQAVKGYTVFLKKLMSVHSHCQDLVDRYSKEYEELSK